MTDESGRFGPAAYAAMYIRQAGLNLMVGWSAFLAGAFILVGHLPARLGFAWAALSLTALVWQTRKRMLRRRKRLTEVRALRLIRRAPLNAGILGACWGLSAFALPYLELDRGAGLIAIALGLSVIAAVTLAAVPVAALTFIAAVTLPYIAVLFAIGTPVQIVLAGLGVALLAVILRSTRINARSMRGEVDARRAAVEARARLEEAQGLWTELSRSAEAFALFDANGRLLLWNDAYRRVIGAVPGALAAGAAWQSIAAACKTEMPEHLLFMHKAAPAADPREPIELGGRWYRSSLDRGASGHVAATHVDVTDLVEKERALLALQAEFVEARDRAEAANAAKSQFLAKMSHELRTPLNAVIGFADLTLQNHERGRADAERHRNYARIISDSGHHLLAIVDDILDLARIEAGTVALHEQPVDLVELLRGARALLAGRLTAEPPRIDERFPAEPMVVRADARLLRQAVLNLLSNAAKFTESPPARIVVGLDRTAEGEARIRVSDRGIGIAADQLEAVQMPFAQVETTETRRYGGVGLGLPLVKQFAALHGGAFRLASTPGQGTTATILLPAERVVSG